MTTATLAAEAPPGPGCRRRAVRKPLLAAVGWLAAAGAALSVAAVVPCDCGHSVCGVWGCSPPVGAVAALHLLWCVALAAAVTHLRAWRPSLVLPVGVVFVVAALAAATHFVARDVLDWLDYAGDENRHFWLRRVLYRLATLTDVPVVQALAAGAVCLALGRPRRSPVPPDSALAPAPEETP